MSKHSGKLIAAVMLAGGLSSGAIADGYEYEPVGKGFAPPPALSWTGPYVGVHGGYAWQDGNLLFDYFGTDNGIRRAFDFEGAVVGVQAGYRHQWGPFVAGVVGDYSARPDSDFSTRADNEPAGDIERLQLDADYLASVRGTLGYEFGHVYVFGNVLVYGTAGIGFAKYELTVNDDPGASTYTVTRDFDEEGAVYGGGVEVMVGLNTTLGVEYLHYDVGTTIRNLTAFPDGDSPDFVKFDDVNVVRATLNIQLVPY